MKKYQIAIALLFFSLANVFPQEYTPIWPEGKMPNSKGMELEKIEDNQRITQVAFPGFYVFSPSKDDNSGAAVVILPSGGYHHLTYVLGGFQLAKWFNTMGITAFVLNYRLPASPDLINRETAPLQDAQRMVRIVRANAEQYGIAPNKIGVMGTSAGGHLSSTLGTHLKDVSAIGDSLDNISFLPDFMIMVSPVISMGKYTHLGSKEFLLGKSPSPEMVEKFSSELRVTLTTPPCFLVHAANDEAVSPMNSILFYQALIDNNIPASLHVFPFGGHGIGLRNNPGSTEMWTSICERWLREMEIIDE